MKVSIGSPIANIQIYIVDHYLQLVPIGIPGELCVAGDGVGAGYLNRPELTAEKFIDNPFGAGKLYRTGDLAYWREDGTIAFVGRNDFQVKIRGLRIELGEIENAILSVGDIQQAVVVVRKNNEGRQIICAFYTGKERPAQELRTSVGERLPKYMVPHIFTHLEEMPLTPNGKINRKALPEIDLYNILSAVDYVAPSTESETALVKAVEAVLNIDSVSILDNFFDLGGDSLKAIELSSELESLHYAADVKSIFEADTIQSLAKKLSKHAGGETRVEYGNVIPATPAQMRVFTSQSMATDSTLYNIPYAFRVPSLDRSRLQLAVNEMISRHESLRTHFENRDGRIMQIIDSSADCQIESLTSDDIASFIRPFDLSVSPLLRVGVFENTVLFDFHHIAADGGSMPVFFRELNELYMGRALPATPVQYGEFAVTPVDTSEDEAYWRSVFSDELPVLELNTDEPRRERQSFRGAAVYERLDKNLHRQILNRCRQHGITPFVFYFAAYQILLSKFSNCEDIVVGIPVSGRPPRYLDTIGMFVNTIALRCKPDGEKDVEVFLREVKETSRLAIEHQSYPFGELVRITHADTPGRNPVFDVMFAYQDSTMTDVIFADQKAEPLPIPIRTAKCDFSFYLMPQEEDAVLMVEYCTDLYRESTIRRMMKSYQYILLQLSQTKKN